MLDQIVQITNGILNPGTSRSSFWNIAQILVQI